MLATVLREKSHQAVETRLNDIRKELEHCCHQAAEKGMFSTTIQYVDDKFSKHNINRINDIIQNWADSQGIKVYFDRGSVAEKINPSIRLCW